MEYTVRAAAIQFVRKISGYTKPSIANASTFENAVEEIFATSRVLIDSLTTNVSPKNREIEAEKANERNRLRFGVAKSEKGK